jgi:hypothetical protein
MDKSVKTGAGSPNRPNTGSHEPKKPAGKPVKPIDSVGIKNCNHGLGLGTGPVRVPGQTGSTGNRPNRSGCQRFGDPDLEVGKGLRGLFRGTS